METADVLVVGGGPAGLEAARVAAARQRQRARFEAIETDQPIRTNAEADGELLKDVAAPDTEGRKLLNQAGFTRLGRGWCAGRIFLGA